MSYHLQTWVRKGLTETGINFRMNHEQQDYLANTRAYLEFLSTQPSLLAAINQAIHINSDFPTAGKSYGIIDFLAESFGWPKGNIEGDDRVSALDPEKIMQKTSRGNRTYLASLQAVALNVLAEISGSPFASKLPQDQLITERKPYNYIRNHLLSQWERHLKFLEVDEYRLAQEISSPLFILHPLLTFPPDDSRYATVTALWREVFEEGRRLFDTVTTDIIRLLKCGRSGQEIELHYLTEFAAQFSLTNYNIDQIIDYAYSKVFPHPPASRAEITKKLIGISAAEQILAKVLLERPEVSSARTIITDEILKRLASGDSMHDIQKEIFIPPQDQTYCTYWAVLDILLNGTIDDILKLKQSYQTATTSDLHDGDNTITILRSMKQRKFIPPQQDSEGMYTIWRRVTERGNSRPTVDQIMISHIAQGSESAQIEREIKLALEKRKDELALYVELDL